MSSDYVKKLERRIHNQRVALRENWQIVDQRAYFTPMWKNRRRQLLCKCIKLQRENKELRDMLSRRTE